MKIFLWMIGFFVMSCSCTIKKKDGSYDCTIIPFDWKKSVKNYDMSAITDSIIQIIPLETNDDCLISKINKIEFQNNQFYIQDNLAQSIYIYDMKGKYKGKIQAVGQGPGEYANLSYMTVTDSSIIIIDHLAGKQIEYSLSHLQFVKEERIFKKIWCTEVFTLPNHLYYVNNWSNSNVGKFRLFSRADATGDVNNYLPFDEEPLSLGINGPVYSINGDEAAVIYSGDNFIYRIKNDEVFPEYEVEFKNKKVVYRHGRVDTVFKDNENGNIIGINAINESDKYLFIDVSVTGETSYTCLYDKLKKTVVVYPQVAVNSRFDNEQVIVHRVINNKIISWREAHVLLLQKKYLYEKQQFNNKIYEKQLNNVLDNLTDSDNPILFIYNLK
jgi:hypothetical protein